MFGVLCPEKGSYSSVPSDGSNAQVFTKRRPKPMIRHQESL